MKTKLQYVHVSNNILNNGKLLVLFMYDTNEEMRLFRMHPRSLVADTTHGTNSERKELFTVAGIDGNNNAFNAYWAYIPCLQRCAFGLLFSKCIPISLERQLFL